MAGILDKVIEMEEDDQEIYMNSIFKLEKFSNLLNQAYFRYCQNKIDYQQLQEILSFRRSRFSAQSNIEDASYDHSIAVSNLKEQFEIKKSF